MVVTWTTAKYGWIKVQVAFLLDIRRSTGKPELAIIILFGHS
jgi:hypothetical protein